MKYYYPFGEELKPVVQQDRTPKKVFVLGVYASAVHARWKKGNEVKCHALAVASEPRIFWDGNVEEAKDIIGRIKIPEELGTLEPAVNNLNGPSAKVLDEHILKPLGFTRDDAWLCDLLPETRLNKDQVKVIENKYKPFIEQYGLNQVTIPARPTNFCNDKRCEEIISELKASQADTIVLLGDIPIKQFLNKVAKVDFHSLQEYVDIYGYGNYLELTIDDLTVKVLPLAHPRQIGALGSHSDKWKSAHQEWEERKSGSKPSTNLTDKRSILLPLIKIYDFFINLLIKNKKIAYFFAHGGVHIIVMLICWFLSWGIYKEIKTYNQSALRQFSMRIEGDTLNNYKLSHVSIHHICNFRNNKSYDNYFAGSLTQPDIVDITNSSEMFLYHFKYGIRTDSDLSLDSFPIKNEDYNGYTIDAVQKVTLSTTDTTYYLESPKSYKYLRLKNNIMPHHTAKLLTNIFHNKSLSNHYICFTSEDTVKEDNMVFTIPSMTSKMNEKIPYYICFYGFHAVAGTYELGPNSSLIIQYNNYPNDEGKSNNGYHADLLEYPPISIENILPKPTEQTMKEIIYRGKDVEKVFEQGGVYFTAFDPIKKSNMDKIVFILTVLIGLFLAFSLDIMVQLIIKWRKLKKEENMI